MASMMFSRMSMATSGRASNEGQAQVFTTVGNYNSEVVAIRKVHKDAIQLDRTQLVELKVMRELRHDNINPFIGACVDTPNICILMQYCPKGSLQDVIENDAISLDWMFKMSFASDITAGLTYLHKSPLKMHGRLKSSNCLLDSRWVVRLTDSGLWTFQANQKKDKSADVGEYAVYRSKLWTAPELLRNPPPDGKGTHKGDIYSFGVVLQEIVTRREAFWNFSDIMTPKEIVDKIIEGGETPLRPDVSDDTCPAIFQSVIEKCWDEIPEHRPELGEIKRAISAANPNKTNNILDNMVAMLEKYANNLEDIVAERTAQLEVEKKKTEVLLYRMLPESVAIKLKNGEAITAESFDAVTIFFSDIVGFTALSAQSTPFQVVDLLNDLYTAFDAIIETVDVYKVETIGDAYMVVSGLPTRNGDRHAGEICTMALKLLSAVETFKIRHRPDDKLKLRIGLHTGPCVAGVVGLTMPRYCLFGDTVNTASRFESNGLPLRIHVSPTTVKLLNTLGGYNVKERGEVFMKGKGNLITYWLLGKDGYTGTLPPFDEEDPAP
ncbi:atrial natriuretic peptide receptor 1-like [Saccoglossus kowalevskii]